MLFKKWKEQFRVFYKSSRWSIISIVILFLLISILTTVQPAYNVSSNKLTEWTSAIDSSVFLKLIGTENQAFAQALPEDMQSTDLTENLFSLATSLRPNDPRSLLGNELPGFSVYGDQILIAGEGTDYTNLPVESTPPLEEVLREREAVFEDNNGNTQQEQPNGAPDTGEEDVVFIYNSHNRESFLPHLPEVSDPNMAQHAEVNVTNVSEYMSGALQANGIGTNISQTDIMNVLNQNGMEYHESYQASRNVVEEAFATNENLQYVFDIHRDSLGRSETTIDINGESYARIMIVVGTEHANYEQNLELATEIHYMMEEMYPGLSRGVVTKQGAGTNGIFNQDLSGNSLLLEIGGVENNMDELQRGSEAFAEVFTELYWDAEEVAETREAE